MPMALAELDRQAFTQYYGSHWKRSELTTFAGAPDIPDPGHGLDEISPVVYYGHPFNPSKAADLEAISAFALQELTGHELWDLDMLDGPFFGQTLPLTSPDGEIFILETLGGPELVVPQSDLVDGTTVAFTSTPGDFNADVAAGMVRGTGLVILNITELGPGGIDNRGHYDTGRRGLKEARLQWDVVILAPVENAPQIAELYAGAAHALLIGVVFVRDEAAPVGTVEREMFEANVQAYRQLASHDPVQARANHIADAKGWRWYLFKVVVRRQYFVELAGRRVVQA